MYSLMKSRRMELDNLYESPVIFCSFLNNQDVLIVYQSKMIDLLSTVTTKQEKIITSFQIQSKYAFVDCKRICDNNCVILTESRSSFYHVEYELGKIMVKEIFINVEILVNLTANSSIVSFMKGVFVVLYQVYLDKIAYFVIFDLNQGLETTKSIKMQELSWVNQHYQIIKPMENTMQFAIFKQTQQQQNDWTLKIISLDNNKEAKIVNLRDNLTENHKLMDIIAKDLDQYYLFVKIKSDSYNKMEVRSCVLLQQHKQFTPSWSILYKLDLTNSIMSEIIYYDSQRDYFLAKNYCLEECEDEIYTNSIQVRKLTTGICMSRLPCNLKSWDFNPSHSLLVDYSQQLEALDKIVIHTRTFFKKKIIFAYFLENNQIFEREKINSSFQEMILSLL